MCPVQEKITDSKEIEKLRCNLIEQCVDGFKWKTLYKCPICDSYWEEGYTNDRFGGVPYLIRVSKGYVEDNWNC
jgi:hypothetical protein